MSTQSPPPNPLHSGSYPASADEGRVISIELTTTGPITVSPSSFSLEGPPCPTYSNGKRSPEEPASPTTSDFAGTISLDESGLPAAGTTAEAEVKGKDSGYYTKCSEGEQVSFDQEGSLKIHIHSIKIELDEEYIEFCADEPGHLAVKELYPAESGTVTWSSANGVIDVSGGTNSGLPLKPLKSGEDEITATYQAGGASYKTTARVKVSYVAFMQQQYDKLWYPDGKLDLVPLLNQKGNLDNLTWTVTPGTSGASVSESGELSYPKSPGTIEVTAEVKGAECKKALAKFTFTGFRIVMDDKGPICDGEPAKFHLEPVGSGNKEILKELTDIKLDSKHVGNFAGNPSGKNKLEFSALDADLKGKVKNCIWFSTGGKHCNASSSYDISATAKADGKEVSSQSTPSLMVTAQYGKCMVGAANYRNEFSGEPAFTTEFDPKKKEYVTTYKGQGTFKRTVEGYVSAFQCNKKSQFHDMLKAEEEYHVGQFEGKNGTLCAELWSVEKVLKQLNGRKWYGRDSLFSVNSAKSTFTAAVNNELSTCSQKFVYPNKFRCSLESEAKAGAKTSHYLTMPCMYPNCN